MFETLKRLIETVKTCRECEWNIEKHELIYLLASLEAEAKEAIAKSEGGE